MKSFSLDFKVKPGSNMIEVFSQVKKYQELDLAGRDSGIVINGVRVPAGYLSTNEQCGIVFDSIINGNIESLENMLVADEEITPIEIGSVVANCASEMAKFGSRSYKTEELDTFINSIVSRKGQARTK